MLGQHVRESHVSAVRLRVLKVRGVPPHGRTDNDTFTLLSLSVFMCYNVNVPGQVTLWNKLPSFK